jgi:hypothetical protein
MTLESMSADAIRPVIFGYLTDHWQGVYQNSHGALIVPDIGHTACFVEPSETRDGRTRVNIRAPILLGVPPSPELFRLVALNATNWAFGALSIYEEDGLNLEFDYAVLADGLSSAVLNYLVQVISETARSLAPDLKNEFGGRFLH